MIQAVYNTAEVGFTGLAGSVGSYPSRGAVPEARVLPERTVATWSSSLTGAGWRDRYPLKRNTARPWAGTDGQGLYKVRRHEPG